MHKQTSTLAAKNHSVARHTNLLLAQVGFLIVACAPPPSGISCSANDASDLERWASSGEVDGCVLEIRATALTSLDALRGLERADGFIIEDNPQLRDIAAVDSLEPIALLTVRNSPLSAELDVTNFEGDLRLQSTEVQALRGQQLGLAVVQLKTNSSLNSINFPNLTSAGSINFEANAALENIAIGLPSLTSLSLLSVTDSPLISVANILALADQANVPASGVFHCGNLDDDPCEAVTPLE